MGEQHCAPKAEGRFSRNVEKYWPDKNLVSSNKLPIMPFHDNNHLLSCQQEGCAHSAVTIIVKKTIIIIIKTLTEKKNPYFNAHTAATFHPDAAVWTVARVPVCGHCRRFFSFSLLPQLMHELGIRRLVRGKNNSDEVEASVYENGLRRNADDIRARSHSPWPLFARHGSLTWPPSVSLQRQIPHRDLLSQNCWLRMWKWRGGGGSIFTRLVLKALYGLPPCGILECWSGFFFVCFVFLPQQGSPEQQILSLKWCL